MDADRLKENLRATARSLGLTVGVAAARPLKRERLLLERRRALGLETPWEPRDLEARCSPARLLPGARAVVVAALSYHRPYPPPPARGDGVPRGVVARYAWGVDYHRDLRARLEELARWLARAVPGAGWAVGVDTGPLLERALAARAGLGWIGKNCCLIVPGSGSWVVLGELVTAAPLPPDRSPAADGCGACDRCLRACPTGALVAPRVLDHRRCLSYATQMKGFIPPALRAALGRRVWGCDTCQEVCPHNRRPAPAPGPPPDPALVRPDLLALARLDGARFRAAWAATAAGWRGRHVLRRNALVALGNARHPAGLPVLVEALADPRPELRAHAAWALGRLGRLPEAGGARDALARAGAAEGDARVRAELERALAGAAGG